MWFLPLIRSQTQLGLKYNINKAYMLGLLYKLWLFHKKLLIKYNHLGGFLIKGLCWVIIWRSPRPKSVAINVDVVRAEIVPELKSHSGAH